MARYEVDATIPVTMYTSDADGNLQNADTTPTLTVEGPGTDATPTLTNSTTGTYTASWVPDQAGDWVGTFTATVDSIVYVTVTRWTVHDTAEELAGAGYPTGHQSWVPAI